MIEEFHERETALSFRVGSAILVPENPGSRVSNVSNSSNPGLCAGKKPGLTGLNFGCLYCRENRAETENS